MHIHKKMAFATTIMLPELSFSNNHTVRFGSSLCSYPFPIFKSLKPSFPLLRTFSSLKTTNPNKNPSPKSPKNPAKTPSSAPWLKKWPSLDPTPLPIDSDPNGANSREPKSDFVEKRGQSAIDRIVLRLRNMGLDSDSDSDDDDNEGEERKGDLGEEKLGDLLKRDWIRPDTELVEEGSKSELGLLPWEREVRVGEDQVEGRGSGDKVKKSVKAPTLAELTMEGSELKRLRGQGMVLRDKVNVPKAGLTQAVLEKIHEKWRKSELVRLKFHEDLAHDMKTAHILVERRTRGLVIWRSGSVMVVYRGMNYEGPPSKSQILKDVSPLNPVAANSQSAASGTMENIASGGMAQEHQRYLTAEEIECNNLLDGLGPRFVDWWGTGVLPVDGDLLPQTIPGFKPSFRLLPAGMRLGLTNAELTNLRKLAKSLPCHFALGRNRNHQGLAAAMVKLWEKSLVAKIAVKRGIQNTNNELMSEELKRLTGGTLLLRNKYFIIIYRGKDFLPTSVAAAVAERKELTKQIQDAEEKARSGSLEAAKSDEDRQALTGTLAEFYEAQGRWGREISNEELVKMREEAARVKSVKEVKQVQHKLTLAQSKKLRAEKLLAKIEVSMVPSDPSDDQETITDEERFTFRKVGLRMRAYLPLGVRGIFDGVIENMHLHWKHRELVKLITKQKTLTFVEETARLLEYESGGILVAIERVPKGYAIIYYRGKNYQRPISLRPRNLLTKAKALKRAVAMQRHEALSQHISELEKNIDKMKKETGYSKTIEDENVMSSDGDFDSDSKMILSEDEDSYPDSVDEEDDESYYSFDTDDDTDADCSSTESHDESFRLT